jgi:predicted transcriptional regulator
MQLSEVRDILRAKVLCGEHLLDREVLSACGSDLMSDVLAFVKEQSVLLTGLLNPQVVRTAEMMDMLCIVFVRGKMPDRTIIELAEGKDIIMMSTDYKMYTACGKLYRAGLVGLECE